MTAKVSIDIRGIKSLENVLERLGGGISTTRLMKEVATFLMTRIKLRTAGGKDADGSTFIPYSPSYALFRRKKGHPTNKVSLFFTGSMMSSMSYKATSKTAKLYFLNTKDKFGGSNPIKVAGLNKKREFFALSDSDKTKVENIVQEEIDRLMRG